MTLHRDITPYDQALALKELGFNEPCFGYYYTLNGKDWKFAEKSEYYRLDDEINIGGKFSLLAPTFSQSFRFFREKYELLSYVDKCLTDTFRYNLDWNGSMIGLSGHKTYEEAELACLNKLIEIVKQK